MVVLVVLEIRIETDDAGVRAQLGKTDEQYRCIDKHSRQPDFLGREETG